MDVNGLIGCGSTKVGDDKPAAKRRLVASLLHRLLPGQTDAEQAISLYSDSKGCPVLLTSLPIELHVSFSYCEDRVWSAIAMNYTIGLDAEGAASFSSTYPFDRIFLKEEQDRFHLISSNRSSAAAALWSCKEAVAKSRKTGFSDIAPLDIQIDRIQKTGGRYCIEVVAGQRYGVLLEKKGNIWLSLAGPDAIDETKE